jgi:hypothetical protein
MAIVATPNEEVNMHRFLLFLLSFAALTVSVASRAQTAVEVPGPSQALFNQPFYTCVRNFYVSTSGSDSNSGTSPATAWLTIQNADTTSRTGGDCINVAPGTYQSVEIDHGGSAASATGYVVYRCQVLDACHVLGSSGDNHLWGFALKGVFAVVDGFELDGNNATAQICLGSDDQTYGTGGNLQAGGSVHHIWVLNSIIHDCALSGVQLNGKEWFYVIHNTGLGHKLR